MKDRGQELPNIDYPSTTPTPTPTPTHLNPRKSLLWPEHWVHIYSKQKGINYISPSNIIASVEIRPP